MRNLTWRNVKNRYRYSLILLKELVRTDFKIRYQNSVLGYLWSLLRPLFMFIVLYIIFTKFLHIGDKEPHWAIALFLGLVMWEFFNEVTKQGLKAVVGKGGMIRKINFPKYIIILSSSLSALINLALNLVVVVIFIAILRPPIGWGYFWIPLFILELYVFSLGVAFVLSTLYVKVRDINFIWEVITRAGFYGSAVMFPMSRVFHESALAGKILLFSPVAQAIQDARHGLLQTTMPTTIEYLGNAWLFVIPIALVFVFLIGGAWYFRRRSSNFAEEI